MRDYKTLYASTFLLTLFYLPQAIADHPQELPDLTVAGRAEGGFKQSHIGPESIPSGYVGASELLRNVPGGNFNFNGAISGQTQYRGLFGTRMNVRVDGAYINSGGPNWMDPPLHYLPKTLVESIEVERGIPSVSSGSSIGGYVQAKTKSSKFTDSANFESQGDIEIGGHTVDDGYNIGGLLGLANNQHRFHFLGSRDEGNDFEFGDGDINGSSYERDNFGAGYGFRTGNNELAVNYRHQDTGPTGTPALPLDIVLFNTELFNAKYNTKVGDVAIDTTLYYTDVVHQMNNFSLRPAPDFFTPPVTGDDRRVIDATSDSIGYSIQATMPFMQGDLRFGFDGNFNDHDAVVSDPDQASFSVTNFNNVESDNYSLFAETEQSLNSRLDLELGLRYTRVTMDADDVSATVTPMGTAGPTAALSSAFNASNREQTDDNIDWVAELDYAVSDHLSVELGAARKTRSPYYVERYLWIPLEVNAGLGDGNVYVGDVNLDPEVSHQLEFGFDLHHHHYYFSPRAFYRLVDDYIQGTASTNASVLTVANLNSDSTPLVFTNVDAELYGFDADWGYAFDNQWRLNGVISYVRGKRRDIDDNLYRIAPLNSRVTLTHERETWSASIEGVFVARQHDISDEIVSNESRTLNGDTPGYMLMNIAAQWRPAKGIFINSGVGNLFDKDYIDHLSGFNRNSASDVPVGSRLPGLGRNLFATLTYQW